MFVLKDIMANGYRAGGNVKFFGTSAEKIKQGLQSRLNFDDVESDAAMPSMLAFPMTAEQYESGAMDTVMSVTTRLLPWEVTNGSHNSFPGGAGMQKLYEGLIGLRAIHFGEDLRASENMEYMSQGSANNALCFLGPHRKFDPMTKGFSNLVPGASRLRSNLRFGTFLHVSAHFLVSPKSSKLWILHALRCRYGSLGQRRPPRGRALAPR